MSSTHAMSPAAVQPFAAVLPQHFAGGTAGQPFAGGPDPWAGQAQHQQLAQQQLAQQQLAQQQLAQQQQQQ